MPDTPPARRGPKPSGSALSNAVRQRRYIQRLKASNPVSDAVTSNLVSDAVTSNPVSDAETISTLRHELAEAQRLADDRAALVSALQARLEALSIHVEIPPPALPVLYSAEARALAVTMDRQGHRPRDIRVALLQRFGKAPQRGDIRRRLRLWSAEIDQGA